jgi:hypothetical protein
MASAALRSAANAVADALHVDWSGFLFTSGQLTANAGASAEFRLSASTGRAAARSPKDCRSPPAKDAAPPSGAADAAARSAAFAARRVPLAAPPPT